MSPRLRGLVAAGLHLAAAALIARGEVLRVGVIVVALAGAASIALEASAARHDDVVGERIDGLLASLTAIGVALGLLGGVWALRSQPSALLWTSLGAALIVAGGWLRRAAIMALGADFVTAARAPRRRCTSGPYALFRHPSEVGVVVIALGAAVASRSTIAIVALLLVALSSSLRQRRENRALSAVANGGSEAQKKLPMVNSKTLVSS